MSNKIKIALCLSGEPRSTMASFPYIYESFLYPNSNYETDVYIHSWKNFRASRLYNAKKIKLEPHIPSQIRQILPFPYDNTHYYNHSLMYYSIRECFNLIEKSYDIYIRCRLDLIFESKLILEPIFIDIINKEYDIFSLHSIYPTKPNGIDDQVLICNLKSKDIISNYFTQIKQNPQTFFENQSKNASTFNAEKFLKNYLENFNIKVINNPLSHYAAIRFTNIFTNDPFNFLDE